MWTWPQAGPGLSDCVRGGTDGHEAHSLWTLTEAQSVTCSTQKEWGSGTLGFRTDGTWVGSEAVCSWAGRTMTRFLVSENAILWAFAFQPRHHPAAVCL